MKIVKWILFGLVLSAYSTEIYAANKYINNMTVLNANDDSDTAEIEMKGNGESCRLSFGSDGVIYDTSCRSMVNSKGLKIYCTSKKKLCKTYDEIYAFIFNPQPNVTTNNWITPIESKKKNIVFSSSNISWKDLGIGIHNPGEIKDWTYYGIKTPKEASEWISALKPLGGISYAAAAKIWKQNGFSASEVKEWILIGAKTPERAQWWIKAGAKTPFEVQEWSNIGVATTNDIYSWTSTVFNTPTKAKEWIDIGVKESQEVKKWLNVGVNTPNDVQDWRDVGVENYNDVAAWKKNGLTTPTEVQEWKDAGITIAEQASRWIQAGTTSLSEIQKWQAIGVNDGNTYKEWKKYVQNIDGAKEWMDASYTLSDVASQVSSGNLSPSDVKWSSIKNKFWILVLIIIGIVVYRALRIDTKLRCPECKSLDFTQIDRKSHFMGYRRYSKKGNKYTALSGLHDTRGRHTKVEEVFKVKTTYKCDECNEVFEDITSTSKEV